MILLVPAGALRPHRPDEHFAAEATAARELGLTVPVINHDELSRSGGARVAVAKVPTDAGPAVYRGWMLRSERYAELDQALRGRQVTLRTTAEQYRRAHELPGWYAALAALTPAAEWTVGDSRAEFDRARRQLGAGAAVLRDYAKSMKHYWKEAAFIPDLADAEQAWAVASRFRELREDDFVGGFVVRRFEHFEGAEVRTWWVNGRCVVIGAHPDTPDDLPPAGFEVERCTSLVTGLGLSFVTLDLALRADGEWRVIELGDGQVSGVDPGRKMAAARCLEPGAPSRGYP